MRLLIITPRQARATGNHVTAERLQRGLAARGHSVAMAETDGDAPELTAAVATWQPQLVLLLHAWRSGQPWLKTGLTLPYAVLLTGTDVHAGGNDPAQTQVTETVLRQAAAILSQNSLTVAALRHRWPAWAERIHYLPPGIVLGDTPWDLRAQLPCAGDQLLGLCPAGIRPVKGLLETIAMAAPLVAEGERLHLAFCGPVLDADYARHFLAAVASHPWTTYLGVIPPAAMPAAMRQADIIINNSASEGLPNALVEAAALGRPIVARDIPGNAAVVSPGINGLLYRDAAEFRGALRRLLDDPALLAALAHPAAERFAPDREAALLEALCQEILRGAGGTSEPQLC